MLRCAITDRSLLPPSPFTLTPDLPHDSLVARCASLAHTAPLAPGGVDLILIREKDLPAGELTSLCLRIAASVRAANPRTRILVSSRADIALAAHLDGVHLSARPGELTPTQIRSLYTRAGRPTPFVSVSCHTLAEVATARHAGADAILFAPVFGKTLTGTSVSANIPAGHLVTPAAGLAALAQACQAAAPIPVFALGGVTPRNAPSCIQAGAAGIAAIRLFITPGFALAPVSYPEP